jgi:cytochrome b
MAGRPARHPSRNTILFIIAVLLLVAGLGTVLTGIMLDALEPDAGERGEWAALSRLLGDDFEEVHTFFGYLLAALSVIHLAYNWRWVTTYLRGLRRAQ